VTFAFMNVAAHEAYSIRQGAGNTVANGLPGTPPAYRKP
jgi:hypothetical protein